MGQNLSHFAKNEKRKTGTTLAVYQIQYNCESQFVQKIEWCTYVIVIFFLTWNGKSPIHIQFLSVSADNFTDKV